MWQAYQVDLKESGVRAPTEGGGQTDCRPRCGHRAPGWESRRPRRTKRVDEGSGRVSLKRFEDGEGEVGGEGGCGRLWLRGNGREKGLSNLKF